VVVYPPMSTGNRSRIQVLAGLALAGVLTGAVWFQTHPPDLDPTGSQGGGPSSPSKRPALPELAPERLATDELGLSAATASLETSQGTIRFKFFTRDAPKTSSRIIELIRNGFYDGQIFFRVVPGFAIQTGDPTGTGNGGSGKNLPAEPNSQRHMEGAIGLARGADPDSGDSQFYIILSPQPQLDGQYTVFGKVTEGLDLVRKMQRGDRIVKLSIE
jgi:peptidylprolyl isomerase